MLINGAGGNLSFLLILRPIFDRPALAMWTAPMESPSQ
jgi:hypothetical protein